MNLPDFDGQKVVDFGSNDWIIKTGIKPPPISFQSLKTPQPNFIPG
jgi:hypothetical protein